MLNSSFDKLSVKYTSTNGEKAEYILFQAQFSLYKAGLLIKLAINARTLGFTSKFFFSDSIYVNSSTWLTSPLKIALLQLLTPDPPTLLPLPQPHPSHIHALPIPPYTPTPRAN